MVRLLVSVNAAEALFVTVKLFTVDGKLFPVDWAADPVKIYEAPGS